MTEQLIAEVATSEVPGSEGKIQVMILRQELGHQLFNEHDAGYGPSAPRLPGHHETELPDDIDDHAAGPLTDAVIADALACVRRDRGRPVSAAPCATSRDKTKAGCAGLCEWCSNK